MFVVKYKSLLLKKLIHLKCFLRREMNNCDEYRWQPLDDLLTNTNTGNYAVLILNTPVNLEGNKEFLLNIWNEASVRLTVDGGTHRWLTWLKKNEISIDHAKPPDLITGDMDSLSEDVLDYFVKHHPSVEIVRTPNQDLTDFMKALAELNSYCNSNTIILKHVYVFADTCGRLDQIMANINVLYKSRTFIGNDTKIFLIAPSSFTWLLNTGLHSISIPTVLRERQEWCALLPIGTSCVVTTTGLKWNLNKGKLEFNGMVSTSNTYDGCCTVTVQTDCPIIWSMGVKNFFRSLQSD